MIDRSRRYVKPRTGEKTSLRPPLAPSGAEIQPPAIDGTKPAPTPGAALVPTPTPMTAWAQLGEPFAVLAAPLYRGLGVEPPPVEHWIMFSTSWGVVVDHYFPGGAGPWPPAILSTIMIAAPLINAKRAARAAAAATVADESKPPVSATAFAWCPSCAALITKGEKDHARQELAEGERCECPCHRRVV